MIQESTQLAKIISVKSQFSSFECRTYLWKKFKERKIVVLEP